MANTSLAQASIGNGQTMNTDAARYYNALVEKIKAETGISIVATEGTRTYARQKYLYDLYRAGKGNPAWSPDDSRAYHLSGRAVDVGSSVGYVNTAAAKAWRARCLAYGFRETVAGEPWHFEWRAEWVATSLVVTSNVDREPIDETTVPLTQRANDMRPLLYRVFRAGTGQTLAYIKQTLGTRKILNEQEMKFECAPWGIDFNTLQGIDENADKYQAGVFEEEKANLRTVLK